jgi:hypothetical protein
MDITDEVIAGFGGAIIGGISIFFLEIWKQVLEFRVACRVVRYEVYENMRAVDAAKRDPAVGAGLMLRLDGWRDGRFKLASVMSEGNWNPLASSYASLPKIQRVLSSLSIPISATDRETLEAASKNLGDHLGPLAEFEAKSRMRLFWIVIRGRIDDYP